MNFGTNLKIPLTSLVFSGCSHRSSVFRLLPELWPEWGWRYGRWWIWSNRGRGDGGLASPIRYVLHRSDIEGSFNPPPTLASTCKFICCKFYSVECFSLFLTHPDAKFASFFQDILCLSNYTDKKPSLNLNCFWAIRSHAVVINKE